MTPGLTRPRRTVHQPIQNQKIRAPQPMSPARLSAAPIPQALSARCRSARPGGREALSRSRQRRQRCRDGCGSALSAAGSGRYAPCLAPAGSGRPWRPEFPAHASCRLLGSRHGRALTAAVALIRLLLERPPAHPGEVGGGGACITSAERGRVPLAQSRSTCDCACAGLRSAAQDPGGVFLSGKPGWSSGVMAASVFLRSVPPAVRSRGR